jgi:rod shape-determining protein MreB
LKMVCIADFDASEKMISLFIKASLLWKKKECLPSSRMVVCIPRNYWGWNESR